MASPWQLLLALTFCGQVDGVRTGLENFAHLVPKIRAALVKAAVQPVLAEMAKMHNISMQFGFADAAGIIEAASGVDDVWTGSLLTPTMLIPLGSATKPLTATHVMKYVEAGQLSLDDKASKWVDPVMTRLGKVTLEGLFGKVATTVTIRDLLGMTSGFPDYNNKYIKKMTLTRPDRDLHPFIYLRSAAKKAHICKPGSCAYYSGTNYVLLGFVLVELTKVKSWEDLDQTAVFPPSLKATGRYSHVKFAIRGRCADYENVAHQITAYKEGNKQVFQDLYYNSCLNGWTMGNIMASARDMATFWFDLFSHRIVKEKTLKSMLNFKTMSKLFCRACGYGLGIMEFHRSIFYTHHKEAELVGHQGTDYGSLAKLCGYNRHFSFGMCITYPEVGGRNCDATPEANARTVTHVSCMIYRAVMAAVGGPSLHCPHVTLPRRRRSAKAAKDCIWVRSADDKGDAASRAPKAKKAAESAKEKLAYLKDKVLSARNKDTSKRDAQLGSQKAGAQKSDVADAASITSTADKANNDSTMRRHSSTVKLGVQSNGRIADDADSFENASLTRVTIEGPLERRATVAKVLAPKTDAPNVEKRTSQRTATVASDPSKTDLPKVDVPPSKERMTGVSQSQTKKSATTLAKKIASSLPLSKKVTPGTAMEQTSDGAEDEPSPPPS